MLGDYWLLNTKVQGIRKDDFEKFKPGHNIFETEEGIKAVAPSAYSKSQEMGAFIKDRFERAQTPAEKNAWAMRLVERELSSFDGTVDENFFVEWIHFLFGNVVKNGDVHRICKETEGWDIIEDPPIQNQNWPDVKQYIESFYYSHHEYLHKLLMYKFTKESIKGLPDLFVFFKYIVMGDPAELPTGFFPPVFTAFNDPDDDTNFPNGRMFREPFRDKRSPWPGPGGSMPGKDRKDDFHDYMWRTDRNIEVKFTDAFKEASILKIVEATREDYKGGVRMSITSMVKDEDRGWYKLMVDKIEKTNSANRIKLSNQYKELFARNAQEASDYKRFQAEEQEKRRLQRIIDDEEREKRNQEKEREREKRKKELEEMRERRKNQEREERRERERKAREETERRRQEEEAKKKKKEEKIEEQEEYNEEDNDDESDNDEEEGEEEGEEQEEEEEGDDEEGDSSDEEEEREEPTDGIEDITYENFEAHLKIHFNTREKVNAYALLSEGENLTAEDIIKHFKTLQVYTEGASVEDMYVKASDAHEDLVIYEYMHFLEGLNDSVKPSSQTLEYIQRFAHDPKVKQYIRTVNGLHSKTPKDWDEKTLKFFDAEIAAYFPTSRPAEAPGKPPVRVSAWTGRLGKLAKLAATIGLLQMGSTALTGVSAEPITLAAVTAYTPALVSSIGGGLGAAGSGAMTAAGTIGGALMAAAETAGVSTLMAGAGPMALATGVTGLAAMGAAAAYRHYGGTSEAALQNAETLEIGEQNAIISEIIQHPLTPDAGAESSSPALSDPSYLQMAADLRQKIAEGFVASVYGYATSALTTAMTVYGAKLLVEYAFKYFLGYNSTALSLTGGGGGPVTTTNNNQDQRVIKLKNVNFANPEQEEKTKKELQDLTARVEKLRIDSDNKLKELRKTYEKKLKDQAAVLAESMKKTGTTDTTTTTTTTTTSTAAAATAATVSAAISTATLAKQYASGFVAGMVKQGLIVYSALPSLPSRSSKSPPKEEPKKPHGTRQFVQIGERYYSHSSPDKWHIPVDPNRDWLLDPRIPNFTQEEYERWENPDVKKKLDEIQLRLNLNDGKGYTPSSILESLKVIRTLTSSSFSKAGNIASAGLNQIIQAKAIVINIQKASEEHRNIQKASEEQYRKMHPIPNLNLTTETSTTNPVEDLQLAEQERQIQEIDEELKILRKQFEVLDYDKGYIEALKDRVGVNDTIYSDTVVIPTTGADVSLFKITPGETQHALRNTYLKPNTDITLIPLHLDPAGSMFKYPIHPSKAHQHKAIEERGYEILKRVMEKKHNIGLYHDGRVKTLSSQDLAPDPECLFEGMFYVGITTPSTMFESAQLLKASNFLTSADPASMSNLVDVLFANNWYRKMHITSPFREGLNDLDLQEIVKSPWYQNMIDDLRQLIAPQDFRTFGITDSDVLQFEYKPLHPLGNIGTLNKREIKARGLIYGDVVVPALLAEAEIMGKRFKHKESRELFDTFIAKQMKGVENWEKSYTEDPVQNHQVAFMFRYAMNALRSWSHLIESEISNPDAKAEIGLFLNANIDVLMTFPIPPKKDYDNKSVLTDINEAFKLAQGSTKTMVGMFRAGWLKRIISTGASKEPGAAWRTPQMLIDYGNTRREKEKIFKQQKRKKILSTK